MAPIASASPYKWDNFPSEHMYYGLWATPPRRYSSCVGEGWEALQGSTGSSAGRLMLAMDLISYQVCPLMSIGGPRSATRQSCDSRVDGRIRGTATPPLVLRR